MIRLLGILGDLPIFRVCQTLAVLGYPQNSEHTQPTEMPRRWKRTHTANCLRVRLGKDCDVWRPAALSRLWLGLVAGGFVDLMSALLFAVRCVFAAFRR